MRRFTLSLLLLALGLLSGALLAPQARAEGPAAGAEAALPQLTADELAAVRRRLPTFDDLDASKKERIARVVLRMRSLTSEERTRLRERGELFRGRGHGAKLPSARGHGGRHSGHAATMAVAQGVFRLALKDLPKETHRAFRAAGIQRPRAEAAFLRRMFESEVARLAPQIDTLAIDDLPSGMQRRFAAARARLAKQDDTRLRHRLATAILMARAGALVQALPSKPEAPERDARPTSEQRKAWHAQRAGWYDALGAAAQARWPKAFEEAKADFLGRTNDLEALGRWVDQHGVPPHEARASVQRLFVLARLESWAQRLAKRDEGSALGHVHALMAAALKDLGRDDAFIQKFLSASAVERRKFLGVLMGGQGGRGGAAQGGRGPGNRGDREGRRRRRDDRDERDGAGQPTPPPNDRDR